MSLLPIIILFTFGFISWCMIYLAFRHLDASPLRRSFISLLVFSMIWFVPLVLVRAPGLDEATVAWASRFLFVAGVFMASALFFFSDTLAGLTGPFRYVKPVVFTGAGVLVLLVLLGFVEDGVTGEPGSFVPVRGSAHPFYIVGLVSLLFYCFFLLTITALKAEEAQLRFQARSILSYGALGLLTLAINNGIVPIFIPGYAHPYVGALGFLFFLAGILRILWRGQTLYLRSIYEKMFLAPLWQIQENFISFIRLSELLNSILLVENETAFNQPLTFFRKDKSKVKVHWHSDELGALAAGKSKPRMPNLEQGILDNLTRLEFDNKRLALALIRAEQIVHQAGGELTGAASLPEFKEENSRTLPYRLTEAIPEIEKNIADNNAVFGIDFICFNPSLFAVLEQMKTTTPNKPVVLNGEPGAGKSTMAKAMHYYHTKADLRIVDCNHHTAAEIRSIGRELVQAKEDGGVLLANIDGLNGDLAAMSSFFAIEKSAVYITVADVTLLEELPKSIRSVRPYYLFHLPPLRDRFDDLTYQTIYYFAKAAKGAGVAVDGLGHDFMDEVRSYHWPGNTSELIMTLNRMFVSRSQRKLAGALALPGKMLAVSGLTALEVAERDVVERYLKNNDFNKSKTASQLGITINTLKAKINKYNLLAS